MKHKKRSYKLKQYYYAVTRVKTYSLNSLCKCGVIYIMFKHVLTNVLNKSIC